MAEIEIEYCSPSLADVDSLSQLGRETFVATFGHLYSNEDLDFFLENAFHPDAIQNDLSNTAFQYRVAHDCNKNHRMIAYCKIGPLRVPIVPLGRAIEIWQLYVRVPYHRNGVGREMMNWAMSRCSLTGANEVYLSVWSGNHRAIRFYERFGFSKVGTYDYMVGKQADHEFIFCRTI